MSTALTIPEVSTLATAVAKSRLFPGLETTEQVFALMMVCQSDGINPMWEVFKLLKSVHPFKKVLDVWASKED